MGGAIAAVITYGGEVMDNLKDTFSLNTDGVQFDLVIKAIALSDGKVYRCKDFADAVEQYGDAEVIVFGKTYFPIFLSTRSLFLTIALW